MLASRSGNRDAGQLIGPRVHWMLAAGRPNPASVAGMTLDPSVIGTLGDGWMHAGPDVWSGIDFGWMVSLAEYDYWDVDRNAVPPEPDSWSDTEPDSRELWAWSKLRIAKGVHEHALAPALAEVRSGSSLPHGQRSPTQLAGIAMLRQVRRAAERRRQRCPVERPMPKAPTECCAPSPQRGDSRRSRLPRRTRPILPRWSWAGALLCTMGCERRSWFALSYAKRAPRTTNIWSACFRLRPIASRIGSQTMALPDDERSSQPKPWLDRILTRRSGEIMLSVAEQDWFRLYEKRAP